MARIQALPLVKETFAEFTRHKAQWLAAALAYFTTFAIAPLIIVIVEIAGIFLGHHAQIRQEIFGYLGQTAGPSSANAVRGIVDATFNQRRQGTIAQVAGWIVFILAAIGLFSAIQDALNTIWDVKPKEKQGIWRTVRERVLSFGLILVIAFLLLVSLAITTGLNGLSHQVVATVPALAIGMRILDFIVSFGVITALFALMFRYLPDMKIAWSDVWLGAAITAALFDLGQFLLGWYLGRAGVSSTYGAFGSLVVFLLWTNYSAQIFLFGAEFTHVFAHKHGTHANGENASRITYGTVSDGRVTSGTPRA